MGFRLPVNVVHRFLETCRLPTWSRLGVGASLNKQFERILAPHRPEGFRSHSFEMLKIRSETTVRFVLTLFIVKRVVKLDYVFLKILLTVLPS